VRVVSAHHRPEDVPIGVPRQSWQGDRDLDWRVRGKVKVIDAKGKVRAKKRVYLTTTT
jgi:hypothetical protein